MSSTSFEALAASLPRLRGLTYSCCKLPSKYPAQPSVVGWLSDCHVAAICSMTRLTQLQLCVNGLGIGATAALLDSIPSMLRLRDLALAFVALNGPRHLKWAPSSPFCSFFSPSLPLGTATDSQARGNPHGLQCQRAHSAYDVLNRYSMPHSALPYCVGTARQSYSSAARFHYIRYLALT